MLNKITGLATAVALLFTGSSATAATYVANRAVGAGSVNLSITTDDTLGILSAANILDWTILVDTGVRSETIRSPAQGAYRPVQISGNGLTATATDLFFNFNGNVGSNYVFFPMDVLPIGGVNFAWQGSAYFDAAGPAEIVVFLPGGSAARQAYSGNQIVASVANVGPGPVPEPATWAMMIMGFGAAGSLLRRRRVVAA